MTLIFVKDIWKHSIFPLLQLYSIDDLLKLRLVCKELKKLIDQIIDELKLIGDGKYDCNDHDCYGSPACNGKEGYFIEDNECIHTIDKSKIKYDTLEECKKDLEGEGLPVWLLLIIALAIFGGLGTGIYFAVRKR